MWFAEASTNKKKTLWRIFFTGQKCSSSDNQKDVRNDIQSDIVFIEYNNFFGIYEVRRFYYCEDGFINKHMLAYLINSYRSILNHKQIIRLV